MLRTRTLLTIVVLPLLLVASAACGGRGEEKATQTPANATATTAAQTPARPTAVTTQVAPGTPVTPTFPGPATATVTVGDQSFTFTNGSCYRGPDDAWLTVNIGQIGVIEYFALGVGNPGNELSIRSAKGGGVFTGNAIIAVSFRFRDTTYTMRGTEENKVTVDAALEAGEFVGTTTDGVQISGSFECGL
jgi:hypothetical protein